MIDRTSSFIKLLYRHHLIRYLFVGGTTFIIDFGLLILLHGKEKMWLPLATFISYSIAVVYNFSLNRWWTFSASETKSLRQHITPYAILLSFNLLFTVVFVSLVSHFMNYAIAKIVAVIIQTGWNYFIYKNVIFLKKEHTSTSADTKAATSKA